MKPFHQVVAIVLALMLLVSFPMSAQAASSSSISRASKAGELTAKDYSGQNLQTAEFANTSLEQSNFSDADLRGAVFNSTNMTKTNLHGADFTNGIAYLVNFKGADLSDAVLVEAMMLRSTFDDVNIDGADFSNAVLDKIVVKKLCNQAKGVNSKTGMATRESLGCR